MKWRTPLRQVLKGLNIDFKPLELTEKQLEEVQELEDKYRSEAWMYRKYYEESNKTTSFDIALLLFCLYIYEVLFILSLIFCKKKK